MDLFWVSCGAAGCSLACLAWLAFRASGRRAAQWRTLAAAAADTGFDLSSKSDTPLSGAHWRGLRPWLRVLGRGMLPFLSWRKRTALTRRAQGAGLAAAWDLDAVIGLFSLAAAGGGAAGLGLALLLAPDSGPSALVLAGAPGVAAVAALCLQWHHLCALAAQRRKAMLREFPFLLDLMTLCVEAGLNLHGALIQAAQHGPAGPLRAELRLALTAMRAGHARAQALDEMAARCEVTAIALWVAAVQQADRLGMSLAPLLRVQAEQERSERFLRAETLAMQAPVRMLFPLVTCMFPCSFLVIGFPIANLLLQSLQ